MTCRDAIREVFDGETGILTTNRVIDRISAKHTDQPWKRNTISTHLIALSVNHPLRRHHPINSRHAFLFCVGSGRYRLWIPEQDGTWVVTETGVRLVDGGEDVIEAESDAETESVAMATLLSLESDLEKCLAGNLQQLEPGLQLYVADGIVGRQLPTGVVGRLDLLTVDASGDHVVIELKAGQADDKVCGQILRYMGWVKKELAGGKRVRGIIVASDFSESLKHAVQAMPNVTLRRYEVRFSFSEVQ
jgi:Endonuclease NucS C-terminal domain